MLTDQEILQEIEKIKKSPYYFATTYLKVDGKPYRTVLTEEEFNKHFKYIQGGKTDNNTRVRI